MLKPQQKIVSDQSIKIKDEIRINFFSFYTLAKNHICFVTFYYS